jgi:hypothetical protein
MDCNAHIFMNYFVQPKIYVIIFKGPQWNNLFKKKDVVHVSHPYIPTCIVNLLPN